MMQEFVDQINKSARSATEDMHTALPGEIVAHPGCKRGFAHAPFSRHGKFHDASGQPKAIRP